jgi:glycosyltransferase involved in cell wall biosynthesis
MRVLIDARRTGFHGTGRYLLGLVPALVKEDPTQKMALLLPDASDPAIEQIADLCPTFRTSVAPYDVRNTAEVGRVVRSGGFDVLHTPHYALPTSVPCACVTTVHDAIHILFPQMIPDNEDLVRLFGHVTAHAMGAVGRQVARGLQPERRAELLRAGRWGHTYAAGMLDHAMRRSERVLTVSRVGGADLLSATGIQRETLLTPNALDPGFAATLTKVQLSCDSMSRTSTILAVTRHAPHKGIRRLLVAFRALLSDTSIEMRLVVVGSGLDRYPDVARLVKTLGLGNLVTFVCDLTDSELITAYRSARVVVVPSDYEGFGLPVLEAQACGAPVIVWRGGALPDVGGPGALVADDISGLVEAMGRTLSDGELATRMRGDGVLNVAKYDWGATARLTLRAYREAFASRGLSSLREASGVAA